MIDTKDRKILRVKDVMKTDFDMIDGMETVSSALNKMKYIQNKCLIVNKRHDDDELGILLISDIARKVLARDKAADRINVYEVMAKPVIAIDLEMDIRYCARLFDRFDISRAPVLKDKTVVGIVSFTDLVMKTFAMQYD